MTEAEWLACTDPRPMLKFVTDNVGRNLCLFACACCRRIRHLLPYEQSLRALELSELYVDGGVDQQSLLQASDAAELVCQQINREREGADDADRGRLLSLETAAAAVWGASWPDDYSEAQEVAGNVIKALAPNTSAQEEERRYQATIVRCIFGNPFRPVTANPSWLAWNEGTVRKIAQSIYEERAFERLLILADALEDAGCDDADILAHCRGDGPHVRGCWVVDLLLGKQ
jgi:hypothetical protein